jgi:hypothetical protein
MKIILFAALILLINLNIFSDNHKKDFSREDIKKLAPAYLENKLTFDNPVFVDVDKDGDFDALKFEKGNVEYYENTGTLEEPVFVLANKHYASYSMVFFLKANITKPVFFADMDGDGDMDIFVVKDKEFNTDRQRTEYKVAAAENVLGLDNGMLITIILVLLIIILVIAII